MGGAIHAGHTNTSSPIGELKIVNSQFDNNNAYAEGGQSLDGAINCHIDLTIINSTFKNSNTDKGGAIHFD
ncbi:hypothetical protein ALNOE001_19740 [Candidatus Methanobinarius endosymbioticus]|uniref:Uncharacterized protein n=1 Tax=Candidatus Methanobinarius endosymbioticus TaxID=2006182 RepID=A0A366M959_9EURY|nr:hypothetical protein ALNOE001_19740 [Candidatus Methanobinarius endosymbioticus]